MLSGNLYGSARDLKFLRVKFWFREFWGSVESPRDFCFFFLNTHTHTYTHCTLKFYGENIQAF